MQAVIVVVLAALAVAQAARDPLSIKSGTPTKDVYKESIQCIKGKISFKPEVYVDHLNKQCAERKRDANCILFCHSENVTPFGYKVLGPDGAPSKEGYSEFINSAVVPEWREKVTKHVHDCIEKHGSLVNFEDDKCAGAGTYYACVNQLWGWDC